MQEGGGCVWGGCGDGTDQDSCSKIVKTAEQAVLIYLMIFYSYRLSHLLIIRVGNLKMGEIDYWIILYLYTLFNKITKIYY